MKLAIALIIVAAASIPGQALAQAAPSSERRLTPEQIEAILAEAAKKREAAEVPLDPGRAEPVPKPQVHGEVGVAVGTGGYREVFGTAVAPIGNDGAAAISLDFVDWGRRRHKR